VDYAKNELHLLVACIGEGTKHMGMLKSGEKLNIMLPLGNGFTLPESKEKKHLLIGGGVGVAPLLFLGKKIKEMGGEPTFLLGARSEKDLLMIDYFEKVGRVFITTEDGSKGEKGFVTNHSILKNEKFDFISTCGPKPMMAAVSKCAEALGIECEVSLENKMACGLGACLCCVEKTKDKGNICICTEGPVINAKRLNW
jgi:dihydroorotate dehydrogenase electron transfer subunit